MIYSLHIILPAELGKCPVAHCDADGAEFVEADGYPVLRLCADHAENWRAIHRARVRADADQAAQIEALQYELDTSKAAVVRDELVTLRAEVRRLRNGIRKIADGDIPIAPAHPLVMSHLYDAQVFARSLLGEDG